MKPGEADLAAATTFELSYAEQSGFLTAADLHYFGRWAEPCDCGDHICEGWGMGHQHEDALAENKARELDTKKGNPQ